MGIQVRRAKAVFLDRDGTLDEDVGYMHTQEQFSWVPGARDALCLFKKEGYLLIVLSNQSGVARGYFTEADVLAIHQYMQEQLRQSCGIEIDAFYYCPHHPEGTVDGYRQACACRKPGTGMFERAAAELSLDPERSFVIGDNVTDILPGVRLGCRTILVRTGYGQRLLDAGALEDVPVDHIADTLQDAADWILERLTRT